MSQKSQKNLASSLWENKGWTRSLLRAIPTLLFWFSEILNLIYYQHGPWFSPPSQRISCLVLAIGCCPFRSEPTLFLWCVIGAKSTWFGIGHPLALQASPVKWVLLYLYVPVQNQQDDKELVLNLSWAVRSLHISHLFFTPLYCAVLCVAYESFLFKSLFALSLSGKTPVLL